MRYYRMDSPGCQQSIPSVDLCAAALVPLLAGLIQQLQNLPSDDFVGIQGFTGILPCPITAWYMFRHSKY